MQRKIYLSQFMHLILWNLFYPSNRKDLILCIYFHAFQSVHPILSISLCVIHSKNHFFSSLYLIQWITFYETSYSMHLSQWSSFHGANSMHLISCISCHASHFIHLISCISFHESHFCIICVSKNCISNHEYKLAMMKIHFVNIFQTNWFFDRNQSPIFSCK